MRTKTILKKWHLLAVTMILLIASLGILSMPVSADSPPPPIPITGNLVVGTTYGPGTQGTYIDIMINGGPGLSGWCVDHVNTIYVGTTYPATIYDYFGQYYPDYVSTLPPSVQAINWYAVAYIINNKIGSWADVQNALWFFTDNIPYVPGSNTAAMVLAAQNYLNSHQGVYIPVTDQFKPMICYISGSQLIFFEYQISGPNPPVPELPAGLLFGMGLLGLGGFITIKRHTRAVAGN
jgi:hypothetical protein